MNKPVTIRIIAVVSIFLFVVALHAQTQAEINAAARADFTKADVDLNKTYQLAATGRGFGLYVADPLSSIRPPSCRLRRNGRIYTNDQTSCLTARDGWFQFGV